MRLLSAAGNKQQKTKIAKGCVPISSEMKPPILEGSSLRFKRLKMKASQDLGNKQLVRLRKSLIFTGFTRPLPHQGYISSKNAKCSKLSDMPIFL